MNRLSSRNPPKIHFPRTQKTNPSQTKQMAIATTIFEACSEKRKRSPLISTFNNSTSPPPPPPPPVPPMPLHSGPFRDNIREFLKHCAEIEDYTVGHNPVWCALLLSESTGVVFPLYVLEENIHSSHPRPLCDRCRCIGWSHHFVSKRRYHLIIPKDDQWNKPLTESSLEKNDHLLHGLIHCNGFGHLLCINGIQANSKSLHGKELMNLWDHLCSILQTREISVEDLSKAGSMDLRLLHGVAYGRTWFGKWGYNFSRGSFGVTQQKYERAIQILSSLDVSTIIHDFINKRQGELVKRIINIYRDASETRLVTISDLFQFMLSLSSTPLIRRKIALTLAAIPSKSSTHTAQQPETCLFKDSNHHSCFSFIVKFDESRWPARRLDDVVRVVLATLEANGSKMDRQTLRDAVRQHIGDTGLIDFVIKNIDKVAVENRFIHRAVNPVTKKLVISLQDVVVHEGKSEKKMKSCADIPALEPGLDANKDLHFLFNYVLLGYPDSHSVTLAIREILDSKHFVKQWQFKCNNDQDSFLELVLRLRPSYNELVKELTRPLPPGELLVVPQYASVDELKLMVQCALRDTYYVMDKFVVKDIQIGEIEEKECQDGVMCGVEQGLQVWVRGCGLDLDTKLRYQGGADDWTVDCGCGARDDDGERMVACDACHVWQHTRCNSIKDNEATNRMFVCCRCKSGRKKC